MGLFYKEILFCFHFEKLKKKFKRSVLYSAPMDMVFSGSSANLQNTSQYKIDQNWGGIPAYTNTGEQIMVYCGIIDILQCYKTLKKMEHFFKSILYDGDTVSVHRPDFYAQRYKSFLKDLVFKQRAASNIPPTILEPKHENSKNDEKAESGERQKAQIVVERKINNDQKEKTDNNTSSNQPSRSVSFMKSEFKIFTREKVSKNF